MFDEIKQNNVLMTKRIETLKSNQTNKMDATMGQVKSQLHNTVTEVNTVKDEMEDKFNDYKKTIKNLILLAKNASLQAQSKTSPRGRGKNSPRENSMDAGGGLSSEDIYEVKKKTLLLQDKFEALKEKNNQFADAFNVFQKEHNTFK